MSKKNLNDKLYSYNDDFSKKLEDIKSFSKCISDINEKGIKVLNDSLSNVTANLIKINTAIHWINTLSEQIDPKWSYIKDFSLKYAEGKLCGERNQNWELKCYMRDVIAPKILLLNQKIDKVKGNYYVDSTIRNLNDNSQRINTEVELRLKNIIVESKNYNFNEVKSQMNETRNCFNTFVSNLKEYKNIVSTIGKIETLNYK